MIYFSKEQGIYTSWGTRVYIKWAARIPQLQGLEEIIPLWRLLARQSIGLILLVVLSGCSAS